MTTAMWRTDEVPRIYLMALCAWREARGATDEAIRGVLHVIQNRAARPKWWGKSIVDVVLKPHQFSSFTTGDPNAAKFPGDDDLAFAKILTLTERVLNHQDEDLTGGAVLYHEATIFPDWAANSLRVTQVGPFVFYKESV